MKRTPNKYSPKKDHDQFSVKNYLNSKGFKYDKHIEIIKFFISLQPDYDKNKFKNRNEVEAMCGYISLNFIKFVEWLDKIFEEAEDE